MPYLFDYYPICHLAIRQLSVSYLITAKIYYELRWFCYLIMKFESFKVGNVRKITIVFMMVFIAQCNGEISSIDNLNENDATKPDLNDTIKDCIPKTCTELGVACGPAADGCGKNINCGVCTATTLADITISLIGDGAGTVTCNSADCPASIPTGTKVTFKALPDANSTFLGWDGDCAGISRFCTIKIDSNTKVTAAFAPSAPSAACHWVSHNGSATWANCLSESVKNGTAACSLSTANSKAEPGDYICMHGGDYNTPIAPAKSGTLAKRITYQGVAGENARITGMYRGIMLDNRSHITIDNIEVYQTDRFADMHETTYIVISNSKLTDSPQQDDWPNGIVMTSNCQFNRLINNIIGGVGYMTANDDKGGVFVLGYWDNPTDTKDYF